MRQNVIVTANSEGNVINMSKNPEYGYVVVKQKRITIKNGFADVREFTALITGKIRVLELIAKKEGQEMPGNIIIEESLTPFDGKHRENDLKRTKDGKYLTTFEGEPIYRRTVYDETGCREDDLLGVRQTYDLNIEINEPVRETVEEVQSEKQLDLFNVSQESEETNEQPEYIVPDVVEGSDESDEEEMFETEEIADEIEEEYEEIEFEIE